MAFTQIQLKKFAEYSCEKLSAACPGSEYFGEPFKHVVIDGFSSDELASTCLKNFPAIGAGSWEHANDADIEIKYRTNWKSEFDIPEGIVDAIRILNSAPFLKAMSTVMGIEKIIPDPYFTGGALNAMMRGGLLDVQVELKTRQLWLMPYCNYGQLPLRS